MEARRLLPLGVGFYGLMIGGAAFWGWSRGHAGHWFPYEGWASWALASLVGVAAGVVGVALVVAAETKVPGVRLLGERFGTIVAGLPPMATHTLAVLSGVGEELLFRGCLQAEIGYLPATALFAVVHTGPDRTFLWWTLGAFLYGLVLGALPLWPGGLAAPILMHVVINAIQLRRLSDRGVRADRPGMPLPPPRGRFDNLKVR